MSFAYEVGTAFALLIGLILVGVVLASIMVAWYGLQARLRAKGYGRLFAILSITFLFVLSCGIGIGVQDPGLRPLALLASPLLWILLSCATVWALPRRNARVFGRRSSGIPFAWLGWAVIASTVPLACYVVWQMFVGGKVPRGSLFLPVALSGLGGYWLRVARRIKSAPVTVGENSERIVLYLRAFDAEKEPFISGPKLELGKYSENLASVAYRPRDTIHVTLEDFLGREISARLGPFVGLGNPTDYIPPEGAIREYSTDQIWRERFADLSRRAVCIVVEVGVSGNLQWELETIRREGMAQKLFFFTTPPQSRRKSRLGVRWRALLSWAAGREIPTWARLAEVLRGAGYDFDPQEPGPGAVVTFDEHDKSMLLTVDARTPAEYVAPVSDWITSRTKTGKYLPAGCSGCGKRVYVSEASATAGTEDLCAACQKAEKLRKMSAFERAMERPVFFYPYLALCLGLTYWLTASWLSPWLAVPVLFGILMLPFGLSAAKGFFKGRK